MTQAMKEAFEKFDSDNPHVWEKFKEFTKQYLAAGNTKCGAKMIWERLRWFSRVETTSDDFKLNNNFTAFYARKFMEECPEYGVSFDLRIAAADLPDTDTYGTLGEILQ